MSSLQCDSFYLRYLHDNLVEVELKHLALIILSSFIARGLWAYGAVPEQAAKAIEISTKIFMTEESSDVHLRFHSITAEATGSETFLVRIGVSGGRGQEFFYYKCGLDKKAQPVRWGCVSSKPSK